MAMLILRSHCAEGMIDEPPATFLYSISPFIGAILGWVLVVLVEGLIYRRAIVVRKQVNTQT